MASTRIPIAAFVVALLTGGLAHAKEKPCRESAGTRIWWSPLIPTAKSPLRVLAVSEDRRQGELRVAVRGQPDHEPATSVRGGPPWSFAAELWPSAPGNLRVELRRDDEVIACRRISVQARGRGGPGPRPDGPGAWRATRAWNRDMENLFSAWIERLFDAPAEATLAFPSLAPVLHDPARNFLWGHLGLREDDAKNRKIPRAEPDCADLPYYLRAYFAWKLALPFALRDCDRGKRNRPPKCGPILHNEMANERIKGSTALDRFRSFLRVLANRVQSGSVRTALRDDETDFYPVALARKALRPGTIYADPYGHVLMLTTWVEQTPERGGLLFAVDGQPDNSVGRKRFWEGNFLFESDSKSAGPGFKAFRPIVRGPDKELFPLTNRALAADPRFAPFSAEQAELEREAFYARLAKLINPRGLDARAAYAETMNALVEQLATRVGSVENGERFMRDKRNPVVPMPVGPKIFETTGPWEDYSTPARDLRLLVAMRVLAGLPARITQHPELFELGGRKPEEVRKEIEALHDKQIHERAIEYRRSDGSRFRLTVADIFARRTALEMAYNPNDCVEIRWGAGAETPDYDTCQRHAPEEQRARMQDYRAWFREARRPPR
ncbi:MAG: hypothetical protein JXP73_19315 [Deltaproteobacteria bacterium]|nr:hypothetical protein [Deltaproteobacteria bacterium]